MQDMLQNKTQVETVNFRLYFKVIIRQNEIQYFTLYFILVPTSEMKIFHELDVHHRKKESNVFGLRRAK